MKNNRIGNIEVPVRIIEDEPWLARCIMSRVIVVRAEHLFIRDAIAYTVISDDLLPNPDACVPPDYDILVSAEDGIVFRKTLASGFAPRYSDAQS